MVFGSPQYIRVRQLIDVDPVQAVDELVAFVANGGDLLEGSALIEDLVADHASDVIDAIETRVAESRPFAELVAHATVHEVGGAAIDRFHALQRRLRDELGIAHWEGYMPIGPLGGAAERGPNDP